MGGITVKHFSKNAEYKNWLAGIKNRVRSAQLKAAVNVNSEMLLFYWELGADIVAKQAKAKWGEGLVDQLSNDLMSESPGIGLQNNPIEYINNCFVIHSAR